MPAEIDLKTIKTMLAIEQAGSFAKAAKILYISQPALTQYIKRIESTLSFPLYYRDNGRCIPTEAATFLLTEGKSLLSQYDNMMNKLESFTNSKNTEIRVGWPTGYTVQYLNRILSKNSPLKALNVNITEDTVEQLLHQLLQKKLNFLLIPALYYHADLIYTTIRQEEFYLAVPKEHIANKLISRNEGQCLADLTLLKDMPFITLTANPYIQFVKPLFHGAGYTPNIIFECKNWNSSHSLVEDGLGLAIVPYWFAEDGHEKINYYRIKSDAITHRTLACVYHRDQTIRPDFQTFIDVMKDVYGDQHAYTPFDKTILEHRL